MQINRLNYEHYLIDYLEGKLSKQDEKAIKLFLSNNPDIAEELQRLAQTESVLEDSNPVMNKRMLYKSFHDIAVIDGSNVEEFCIAYHEGDLDDSSRKRLVNFIDENAKFKPLFEFYGKIQFQADNTIRYLAKNRLKKVQVFTLHKILYTVTAGVAAAAAVILLWVTITYQSKVNSSDQIIVDAKKSIASKSQNQKHTEKSKTPVNINPVVKNNEVTTSTTFIQLAKIDSSTTKQPDKIVLASLDLRPLQLENEIPLPDTDIKISKFESGQPKIIETQEYQEKTAKKKRFTLFPPRNEILYSAVNFSVKGFNTLTENELAIHASQNDKGKFTAIEIDGENFEFKRRMTRNNQN